MEHFQGRIFEESQWNMWPPLYHIILSGIFHIIDYFGWSERRLEIILTLQIILCSLSVYALYYISLKSIHDHLVAILAASTYAFSYIMIYFKAFVMSENISIPLSILAIWFLFSPKRYFLLLSGAFLAIATGIRPADGIFVIPFIFYILLLKDPIKEKIKKTLFFILPFFTICFLILSYNSYISHGKLKGFAAYGGLNFYQGFSKICKVSSHGWCLIPAALSNHPEYGTQDFQEPIYDSDFFFKLGITYIKNHPSALLKKFCDYKYMIFGPFTPSSDRTLWSERLILLSRYQALLMAVVSLLIPLVFTSRQVDKNKLFLLASIPLYCLGVNYFILPEFRYFFTFAFIIHITFFAVVIGIIRQKQENYPIVSRRV